MLNWVLWISALVLLTVTLLPLTNSVVWWVRMWDFPRIHVAAAALVFLLVSLPLSAAYKPILAAFLGGIFVFQAVQIFPYTPLAGTEIDQRSALRQSDEILMLSINVLMENDRHDDLKAIIEREDPDVLLLMETDQVWHDALRDSLDRYATIERHIADDHYGLIFATRLKASRVELLWPVDDVTPAVRAVLTAPNGVAFNFIGLHPRPPVPGNTTEVRDKQIKDAALMTQSSERPTVVMGDFNDVAWSWSTRRFKRYGNLLEPRVGRGMMPSFHADRPFLRFPIDQLFMTADVGLVTFQRLENFGSDHFPISAKVFFETQGLTTNNQQDRDVRAD